MKKTLTQITLLFFAAAISFSVSAQNSRSGRTRSNLKSNFASPRVTGNIIHSAGKNTGTTALTSAISGFYTEDFEGTFPPAGWQAIDVLDNTGIWGQSAALPYSGLNSAYMVYSPQGVPGEDWLILPQFTVAAGDSFSFWFAVEYTGYPPDNLNILVSTTDSALTSFTNVVANLSEGVNYPTTQAVYQYYTYDLSSFAGQDIYVAFQNTNTYGDGIYIDKVSIGATPAVNAASVSIDLPNFVPVGTTSPMATFLNSGIAPATFPVTMTITGGYTSTKSVTSLSPGGTIQVTFDPWTTSGPGAETVSVQTQLVGDGLASDDSIATTVQILEPFTNYGWVSKPPMSLTRFDAASGAVNGNDTSYLVAAGGISTGAITAATESFFNVSNSWSNVAAISNGQFTASAASYGNKIYVIGGYNPPFVAVGDNQIYDVTTGSWTNGAPMPVPVGDYAMGVYQDSLFYYMGGYDGAADEAIVQIYDPATDSWFNGTSMPVAGAAWRGGISGNKIVVTTGYSQATGILSATYVGVIDAVDPAIITWSQWDDYPGGSNARMAGGQSLDDASGLVIFTGGDPTGSGVDGAAATFAYDVNSNTWKVGPEKITPVNNLCNLTSIVDNDSLWVVALGGNDATGEKDVNEWLNLGPYTIVPVGINTIDATNSSFTCYPNPFLKYAEINFTLSQKAVVKAVIVDLLGNFMEELCNKEMNSGNQQVRWNAAGYSNGVYFCNIIVNGGKSVTQKLLKY
jgi:hypothetical protein